MPIGPPPAFLHAQRQLVDQLQSLPTPTMCVYRLSHYINFTHSAHVILRDLKGDYQKEIRQCVSKVFDLIWEWVTRPRTEQEVRTIIKMKCTCTPEERRADDHTELLDTEEWMSPDAIAGWLMVDACLYVGSTVVPDCKQPDILPLNKLRRREHWPHSIRSFLPHGAARTIEGLSVWLKFTSPSQLFSVDRHLLLRSLDNIILIFRPLVVPHVIVSPAILGSIYQMKHVHTSFYIGGNNLPTHKEEQTLVSHLKYCHQHTTVIYSLVTHMTNEMERSVFHHSAPAELLAAYEGAQTVARQAAQTISLLVRRSKDDSDSDRSRCPHPILQMVDHVNQLKQHVTHLVSALYLDLNKDTTKPQGPVCSSSSSASIGIHCHAHDRKSGRKIYIPSAPSPATRLKKELTLLMDSQRCCAPNCLNTVIEGRLWACAGCSSMVYCSRRCQKRGWTYEGVAHRMWCSKVAELGVNQELDTPPSPSAFKTDGVSPAISNAEMSSSQAIPCATELENRARTAREVMEYLKKLALLKLKALNPDAVLRH
jgi:hypothetical protein